MGLTLSRKNNKYVRSAQELLTETFMRLKRDHKSQSRLLTAPYCMTVSDNYSHRRTYFFVLRIQTGANLNKCFFSLRIC